MTLGWQILPAASSSSLGLLWKGTGVTCKSPVSQLAPGNPGIQEAKQSKQLMRDQRGAGCATSPARVSQDSVEWCWRKEPFLQFLPLCTHLGLGLRRRKKEIFMLSAMPVLAGGIEGVRGSCPWWRSSPLKSLLSWGRGDTCFPFPQSWSKLCLRNFFLFVEYCHFHLKWLESKQMQKGADVAGLLPSIKMDWWWWEMERPFPRGGTRAPEGVLGAGRELFLAEGDLERCSQTTSIVPAQAEVKHNYWEKTSLIQRQLSNLIYARELLSKWCVNGKNLRTRLEKDKITLLHPFLWCCSWCWWKSARSLLWCQKAAQVIVKNIKWISWESQAQKRASC